MTKNNVSWIAITILLAIGELPRAYGLAPPEGSDTALAEVVVTAQKRPEEISKVPISISVFSREQLEDRNLYDFADVANVTPGVDYANLGAQSYVSIRGINSSAAGNASPGYSTTAIYIDDVPLQVRGGNDVFGASPQPKVFDLDRVEVLRGPQGTLFGAGAEGGIIRFITPDPNLTTSSGYLRTDVAGTAHGGASYEVGVAQGGPIVDNKLGFRVSAWYRRDGGYIDHESPIPGGYQGDHSGRSDSEVVRAALKYSPTESISIQPSVFFQDIYFNDQPTFDPAESNTPGDTFTHDLQPLPLKYSNISSGRFVNNNLLRTPSRDRFYLPSLKFSVSLPGVELTSVTSYLDRSYLITQDATQFYPYIFGLPGTITAAGAGPSIEPLQQNVFTQELRIQSSGPSDPLQWLAGVFYTHARQRDQQYLPDAAFADQVFAATGMSVIDAFKENSLPGDIVYEGLERQTDTQISGFGEATYRVLPWLSTTAGVRVARERNDYSIYQDGPLQGGPAFLAGEQSQTVVDPKFGINVPITPDEMLYVTAAKGDRIGGINFPFIGTPECGAALVALGYADGAPTSYRSDHLWSYEIGAKGRLFEERLRYAISAFHIDWSDVQLGVFVPACSESFTSNLGAAKSNGYDLECAFNITEHLSVGLNVGYTNARSSVTVKSNDVPVVVKGEQLNKYGSPVVASVNAEYGFMIVGMYKGYVRADDTYHSRNPGPYGAEFDPTFIPNPAYNQLNLHLGVTWGGWETSAYALNALNSHPVLYNQSLQQPIEGAAFTIRPLTLGVKLRYQW